MKKSGKELGKKKTSSTKEKTLKKAESDKNIEKALVENFVALQKIMANLANKFDNLSDQITKLLQLFEISAKAIAEKDFEKFEKSEDKDLLKRLDTLLDQNKTIAKGLTLIHEKSMRQPISMEPNKFPPRQPQRFPSPQRFKDFKQSRY
jgi:type II secretory pathway component PulF